MRTRSPAADPDTIALRALAFIAGDETRLERFLGVTGLGPDTLRAAAGQPGFLAGVLDHLAADDELLQAFAADAAIPPEVVAAARERLGGRPPAWD